MWKWPLIKNSAKTPLLKNSAAYMREVAKEFDKRMFERTIFSIEVRIENAANNGQFEYFHNGCIPVNIKAHFELLGYEVMGNCIYWN